MNEIRHNREKLMADFFFCEINEEEFEKEFDKLKEQKDDDIPANLLYSPDELERWLDDTSAPLSDDEMRQMSAYFE